MTKQCYSFKRPDNHLLWFAGIYQEFPDLGGCYSTITREPAPPVYPIHDRQLASLSWDWCVAFLAGELMDWSPDGGELVAQAVPSPLERQVKGAKRPPENSQGELF